MLILVAGVSGHLGKHLAQIGLEKGHQIRGFGRSPSKLPPQLLEQLESCVECDSYDDKPAVDTAASGTDAVICAYTSHADAILDAQLALLRAVERAGIKVYHAHSWNCDWTKIGFGDWEHYDAYLSFRRHVELTSAIKPVYVFTGIVGEFAVSPVVGIAHLQENADGKEQKTKTMAYWGDGDAKWDFTYMEDAARFSIDLITTDKSVLAGNGGFFRIHSAEASAKDVARAYEKIKSEKVELKSLGGLEELNSRLEHARATTDLREYFSFGNYYIQAASILGIWKMESPTVVGGPDAVERLFEALVEIPVTYQ